MGDEERHRGRERPANDNGDAGGPDPEALRKLDAVALKFARIIGRRMAREDFEQAMHAANDNAPKSSDEAET
ncbi:hypothetical protein [Methyloceanibacter sp.]|uniref:hypothetical protein n=1 Tax=Methyloceanibacter sp. TaxID=1965321 RepID=UPI002C679D99|nr:hypothetical protein [Methyloceanibacter sp.]HML91736.1 hypothetical protein [Methyloceanibacter sp.]